MADDLLTTLTRFHREVVLPDVRQAVKDQVGDTVDVFRNETNSHFDALYHRLEVIETDYQAVLASVNRIENEIKAQKHSNEELRHELGAVKVRLAELEERVAQIESEL